MDADRYENLWRLLDDDDREELSALAVDDELAPSQVLVRNLSAAARAETRSTPLPVVSWATWAGGAEDSRAVRLHQDLVSWVRRRIGAT